MAKCEISIPTSIYDNYGFIVVSALRYALWRHSYAVSLTADYIRDNWQYLNEKTRHNIILDIEEHLENVRDEWANDPLCDMDLKTWENLLNDLKSNGSIQN